MLKQGALSPKTGGAFLFLVVLESLFDVMAMLATRKEFKKVFLERTNFKEDGLSHLVQDLNYLLITGLQVSPTEIHESNSH